MPDVKLWFFLDETLGASKAADYIWLSLTESTDDDTLQIRP